MRWADVAAGGAVGLAVSSAAMVAVLWWLDRAMTSAAAELMRTLALVGVLA